MKKMELEVYSEKPGSPVLRMPGRQFPGVLIQGDAVSIMFWHAMAVLEGLDAGNIEDAKRDALILARALEGDVEHCEATLIEHGIDFDDQRDKERTTKRYKHWLK